MHAAWKNHIESTPDVLRGKPRIKGTRIPVALVLGFLADGYDPERIIIVGEAGVKVLLNALANGCGYDQHVIH